MQGLSYEYDVSKLWLGGSYGNIEIFTRTDARSNLAGLWCAEDDQLRRLRRAREPVGCSHEIGVAERRFFRRRRRSHVRNTAEIHALIVFRRCCLRWLGMEIP